VAGRQLTPHKFQPRPKRTKEKAGQEGTSPQTLCQVCGSPLNLRVHRDPKTGAFL
jgi:hypothetical protein